MNILISGQLVEQVKTFSYLEVSIMENGCVVRLRSRVDMVNQAIGKKERVDKNIP